MNPNLARLLSHEDESDNPGSKPRFSDVRTQFGGQNKEPETSAVVVGNSCNPGNAHLLTMLSFSWDSSLSLSLSSSPSSFVAGIEKYT